MELLKGTAPTVEFVHPTPDTTSVSAVYSLDGAGDVNVAVSTEDGISTLRLPYLTDALNIRVTWSFTIPGSGTFSEVENYEVIRPYLSIPEVKKILGEGFSDEEAKEVEAAVRHVINAHTGQSFGLSKKALTVEGHGESALRLPERLVSIEAVNTLSSVLDVSYFIIISDGWYIKKGWADATAYMNSGSRYWGDAADDDHIYHDPNDGDNPPADTTGMVGPLATRPGGVIVAPSALGRATSWRDDYPFTIKGVWGYERVPEAVKEAAKLLVNDYACSEALYRDRYLESIKAADWRLQFSSRAWEYTGNARADLLLSEFVLLDWAVI